MTMLNQTLRAKIDQETPIEGIGKEINALKNQLKAVYDFTSLGGAVGSIPLVDDLGNPAILPLGAIVKHVLIDVITAPTSGGAATIAVTCQTAADLIAATAKASFTGLLDGVPANTAATAIKLTAQRQIAAVVAVAALTAGKFNVIIEWSMGN